MATLPLKPVVKTDCRSERSPGGIAPGRFVQPAKLLMLGLVVARLTGIGAPAGHAGKPTPPQAGCEPAVGFAGSAVVFDVPDSGAMTPRAKMSYRLIG